MDEAIKTGGNGMTRDNQSYQARIMHHLQRHAGKVEKYDAPRELTREGICHALDLTKPQVANCLARLSRRGLLAKYLRHVDGFRARKTVYQWISTADGTFADLRMAEVAEIRAHLRKIDEIMDRTNNRGAHTRRSKDGQPPPTRYITPDKYMG